MVNTDTTGESPLRSIWSEPLRRVTLANLTLVALVAFDGLAVIAALPSIAADLGQVSLLPWTITGYIGASAVAIIIAGPVIDTFGTRYTFRAAGGWFLLTSAGVALAPTMPWLLLARGAQGLGGGLVMAVTLAATGLVYPEHLRPRAFGANSSVWAVMAVAGPALAATLLTAGGWRVIFYLQLPLAALALVMAWRSLPTASTHSSPLAYDIRGIVILTVLAFASPLALSALTVSRTRALALALVTVLAIGVYWWHSGRVVHAVLNREHLTRLPLRWIHATSALVMAAGLAADNYLPFYLEVTRGQSRGFAAFSVLFLSVGWTAAALAYGQLSDRVSEIQMLGVGATTISPSLLAVTAAVFFGAPLPLVFAAVFAVGFSIGSVSTPGLTLLQRFSADHEMGRVNAAHQFLRMMASTYGIALAGTVLLLVVQHQLGDAEVVRSVLAGESTTAVGQQAADAIRDGIAATAGAAAVLGVLCFGAAILLRRNIHLLDGKPPRPKASHSPLADDEG